MSAPKPTRDQVAAAISSSEVGAILGHETQAIECDALASAVDAVMALLADPTHVILVRPEQFPTNSWGSTDVLGRPLGSRHKVIEWHEEAPVIATGSGHPAPVGVGFWVAAS